MTVLLYLNFKIKPIQSAQHKHSYTVHKPFTQRTALTLNNLSENKPVKFKTNKNQYPRKHVEYSAQPHNDFMGLSIFLKKKKA